MGCASSITERGYDEAWGVVMKTPDPLPVDDLLVLRCERLIRRMNRSERKRIHRTLLDESRSANDKLTTDNSNIAATRLTRDDYASLLNICDETNTDISAFLRKVITREIKRSKNENQTNSL